MTKYKENPSDSQTRNSQGVAYNIEITKEEYLHMFATLKVVQLQLSMDKGNEHLRKYLKKDVVDVIEREIKKQLE